MGEFEFMAPAVVQELLFVDSHTPDLPVVLAGLRSDVQPVVLQPGSSVAVQISSALEGYADLRAIHVMAHGGPGAVRFASGDWSVESLRADQPALTRIGAALAVDGSLNLWSCRTAQGDGGRAFVDALSIATGAKVAASSELIGSARLGGRWTLDELDEGASPLTASARSAYEAVLDAPSVVSVTDSTNSPDNVGGTIVTLTVTFSSSVTVAPHTELLLSDNSVAVYTGGSGGNTLTFEYIANGLPDQTTPNVTLSGVFAGGLFYENQDNETVPFSTPANGWAEPLCFWAGTLIATPDGERTIESLQPGDLVLTAGGDAALVRWIGRQTISRQFSDPNRILPVRIRAGALGEQSPVRDLLVSPGHAIFIDGLLAQAASLINDLSIVREMSVPQTFVYFHIELDRHALVLADGAAAESFIDNVDRGAFDNWVEREAPETMREMNWPRAKAARQVPDATRRRLLERAVALYGDEQIKAA